MLELCVSLSRVFSVASAQQQLCVGCGRGGRGGGAGARAGARRRAARDRRADDRERRPGLLWRRDFRAVIDLKEFLFLFFLNFEF